MLIWLASNFSIIDTPSIPSNPGPHLDTEYNPLFDIDIVVSMYKEPIDHVEWGLKSIRKIPGFQTQRLFIYTKDENANIEAINDAMRPFKVIHVPNVGREGETYLRHIVDHWDDLAKHTMFIQADIHNPREFIPRVRDYFDAERTGMLSLGFPGNVCDCANCGDRFGWHDDTGMVPSLYKKVYQTDEACNRDLLSYKGQFIASARRIRGVKKEVYEDLWKAIRDPNSWAHEAKYLRGRRDEMSAPIFGYTLERVWGLLMQCSDLEIAWKCPTLLSGKRRGGSKADCQCFDETSNGT
ncbi:hypothetical protein NA57DRAFT_48189 [Rhizodiscina lignyota]|uniref:Uncharacterized protein n=1 Tax=Rhizodiscina lignyota TaxID=1504668 RepID=A0A9P4I7J8_9PEZI|nr:hypothetical protein NA57DRAFT_48189 [Rhizodiscina lignyota]